MECVVCTLAHAFRVHISRDFTIFSQSEVTFDDVQKISIKLFFVRQLVNVKRFKQKRKKKEFKTSTKSVFFQS